MVPESATTRPRVEGDREQQILDATITVLAETGYDRLTMDAVATQARASKATLYRRWSSKPELVVEAICSHKAPPPPPPNRPPRGGPPPPPRGEGGTGEETS
jgi:hypothetical protein